MFCAKCGSKLEEEARFCTKCGAPIDESRPEEGRDEDGAAPCSAERPKTAPGAEDAPNATRPDVACVLSIAGFGIPHQFFSPVTT